MWRLLPFAIVWALAMGLTSTGCARAEVKNVGDITVGVIADKTSYSLGTPVKVTYAIRNQGVKPISYTFSSGKLFDVWVTRLGAEIYRYSTGRMYTQAIQQVTLQPNEVRRFEITWNQVDKSGKAVGPGTYIIYAQLTPKGNVPPAVKTTIQIGAGAVAVVPVDDIREAVDNASALDGKSIYLTATFKGLKPNPGDSNTKAGPPVTSSDWAICDSTGCMYVTGSTHLDMTKDVGTLVNVTGKLQRASNGEVYLVLTTVQKAGGS